MFTITLNQITAYRSENNLVGRSTCGMRNGPETRPNVELKTQQNISHDQSQKHTENTQNSPSDDSLSHSADGMRESTHAWSSVTQRRFGFLWEGRWWADSSGLGWPADRSQTHLTSVDCKRRDSRTKTETLRLLHAHPASEGSFKTEHLSLISESLSLNTLMGLCSRKTHLSSGTSVIDMSVCLLKSTPT